MSGYLSNMDELLAAVESVEDDSNTIITNVESGVYKVQYSHPDLLVSFSSEDVIWKGKKKRKGKREKRKNREEKREKRKKAR